jgi:hypothetical protein
MYFAFDDVAAEANALVTDINGRPGDELVHLLLLLVAERACKLSSSSFTVP